ncbi:hypothetical protein PR048_028407 [Dryococelus australis]|uniref:Uncharacterized protein n=1 Tax=Dryococelus australis TaxID=614101 RepID=A0ABQ9GB69_9NEOP|nr:hypothetical protein PR048_028407 [Dryococelus australis]
MGNPIYAAAPILTPHLLPASETTTPVLAIANYPNHLVANDSIAPDKSPFTSPVNWLSREGKGKCNCNLITITHTPEVHLYQKDNRTRNALAPEVHGSHFELIRCQLPVGKQCLARLSHLLAGASALTISRHGDGVNNQCVPVAPTIALCVLSLTSYRQNDNTPHLCIQSRLYTRVPRQIRRYDVYKVIRYTLLTNNTIEINMVLLNQVSDYDVELAPRRLVWRGTCLETSVCQLDEYFGTKRKISTIHVDKIPNAIVSLGSRIGPRGYSTCFGTSRERRGLSVQMLSYIFEWFLTSKGRRRAKRQRRDGGVKPPIHTVIVHSVYSEHTWSYVNTCDVYDGNVAGHILTMAELLIVIAHQSIVNILVLCNTCDVYDGNETENEGDEVTQLDPPLPPTDPLATPSLSQETEGMIDSGYLASATTPPPHAEEAYKILLGDGLRPYKYCRGSRVGSLVVEANWLCVAIELRVVPRETSAKGDYEATACEMLRTADGQNNIPLSLLLELELELPSQRTARSERAVWWHEVAVGRRQTRPHTAKLALTPPNSPSHRQTRPHTTKLRQTRPHTAKLSSHSGFTIGTMTLRASNTPIDRKHILKFTSSVIGCNKHHKVNDLPATHVKGENERGFSPALNNEHLNAKAGETGDLPEYPPNSGIVRHDSHLRKSGVTRPGIEIGSPWRETNSLTAQPSKKTIFLETIRNVRTRTRTHTSMVTLGYQPGPSPWLPWDINLDLLCGYLGLSTWTFSVVTLGYQPGPSLWLPWAINLDLLRGYLGISTWTFSVVTLGYQPGPSPWLPWDINLDLLRGYLGISTWTFSVVTLGYQPGPSPWLPWDINLDLLRGKTTP